MERSLAGMLFLVAAVAMSIGVGAWWMQRIVFTPDGTRATTAAILEEPDIRVELNTLITAAAAPATGQDPAQLSALLENVVLSSRPGAAVMAPTIEQIHQRVIGNRDEPVELTGTDMVPMVRDEHAADAASITLPIGPIGVLRTFKDLVGWIFPIAGGLALVLAALGVLTRPDRRDVFRGLGELGLALAASMLVFGYLLPVHFITALDNQTWSQVVPRLAMRTLPVVLGSAGIFALAGMGLILASTSGGKRRQWSTPLSVARYRGGDNPGWG